MYHYDGLAPTFKSNANSSCEQLWKVQAAFILQSLQSSGATVKVPAWLQSVAATKPTSIDYAALDACLSCTPPKAPPPKLPSPPSPPLSPSPSLSPLPSPAPSPKAAQGPSTSPQPTAPTSGASPYPISPPPSLSVSPSNAGSPTPPPSSGASAMSARIITIIMSIIVHYVIQ